MRGTSKAACPYGGRSPRPARKYPRSHLSPVARPLNPRNNARGAPGDNTMPFHTTVRNERFTFADLREVFARANEEKSGDHLAGVAARTERERVAAKMVLADVTLGDIVDNPLID